MKKILISDKISSMAISIFEQKKIKADYKPGLGKKELIEIIGSYDGLVVRSTTKDSAEVLKHCKKLKIIGRAGIGTDNID